MLVLGMAWKVSFTPGKEMTLHAYLAKEDNDLKGTDVKEEWAFTQGEFHILSIYRQCEVTGGKTEKYTTRFVKRTRETFPEQLHLIFGMDFYSGHQRINPAKTFSSSTSLFICYLILGTLIGVDGWTYHYSNRTMNWIEARKWCQAHYTDMVAIQNQEENVYLDNSLPRQHRYYWIGIRKQNGVWTWVGTKKSLTAEASNWAKFEPNNEKRNEDCVEIYIKRKNDTGKWNDESCFRKKTALCYKASCRPDSCSGNGECVEMINDQKCECFQGFHGVRCENVAHCGEVDRPRRGFINCSHPFGNFSYGSECRFGCENGYQLIGSGTIQCTGTRVWSAAPPRCEAVQCRQLVSPAHGSIRCTHPLGSFSYTAECEFHCEMGYRLTTSSKLLCGPGGQWTDSQPQCEASCQLDSCSGNGKCVETNNGLMCECFQGFYGERCESTVDCEEVGRPSEGFINCSHPFGNYSYHSECQFGCQDGYQLVGSRMIQCTASREWSATPPHCEAIHCAILQAPQDGNITCTDTAGKLHYGSTCSFTCHAGFTLHGSEVMECDASGDWVGQKPLCRGDPDLSPPLVAVVTVGGAGLTALSAIAWFLKQLRQRKKVKQFDLNSGMNSDHPPQVYKISADSLI